jgi:hypothetical protein
LADIATGQEETVLVLGQWAFIDLTNASATVAAATCMNPGKCCGTRVLSAARFGLTACGVSAG